MYSTGIAPRGFTLIEMSAVLVIIGLIVGAILVGRNLIRAAEIRSVLTDIERFNTAANTFKGKYNCLPGDCPNATAFFGKWPNCGYGYAIPAGNGTCNGNGDNEVMLGTTARGTYWAYDETVLFWQHLSLAGLIDGSFSAATDGSGFMMPGVDVPWSSLADGCFSVNYSDSQSDGQYMPYAAMNANMFALGSASVIRSFCGGGGLYSLPASDALAIDEKIDDGMPFKGNVQTPLYYAGGLYNYSGNSVPGCTNENFGSPPISSAQYAISARKTTCELYFKAEF